MIDPDIDAIAPKDPAQVAGLTAVGEASDQGWNGMQAVINSGQNRVKHPGWWGDDLRSVFLDHEQYDAWLPGPDRDRMLEMSPADPIYRQALMLGNMAVAGTLPDITGGADSYYAVTIAEPAWVKAPGTVFTKQIGAHRYYITTGAAARTAAVEQPAAAQKLPPAPIPIPLPPNT